ncbi:MAG: hypothetical protein LBS94_03820 [Prevotellaceae bacterium]|jgi:sugar lactone lactonase YvrE|nr:hypothetical protein [Prevotellaceae bacterium]
MKKMLIIAAAGIALLSASCTGVKSTARGLENEAFLELVGNPNAYSEGVEVNVDDKTTFTASVNKDHADRPKGKVYAISTGTHTVTVTHKGSVLFKKQIFVSAQETKKIMLP